MNLKKLIFLAKSQCFRKLHCFISSYKLQKHFSIHINQALFRNHFTHDRKLPHNFQSQSTLITHMYKMAFKWAKSTSKRTAPVPATVDWLIEPPVNLKTNTRPKGWAPSLKPPSSLQFKFRSFFYFSLNLTSSKEVKKHSSITAQAAAWQPFKQKTSKSPQKELFISEAKNTAMRNL